MRRYLLCGFISTQLLIVLAPAHAQAVCGVGGVPAQSNILLLGLVVGIVLIGALVARRLPHRPTQVAAVLVVVLLGTFLPTSVQAQVVDDECTTTSSTGLTPSCTFDCFPRTRFWITVSADPTSMPPVGTEYSGEISCPGATVVFSCPAAPATSLRGMCSTVGVVTTTVPSGTVGTATGNGRAWFASGLGRYRANFASKCV